jgi:hypothetical protein
MALDIHVTNTVPATLAIEIWHRTPTVTTGDTHILHTRAEVDAILWRLHRLAEVVFPAPCPAQEAS